MFRRNRKDMLEAKPEKLRNIGSLLFGVDFVDYQKDFLLGSAQKTGQFLVGNGNGSSAVYDEEDNGCGVDCNLSLSDDFAWDFGFVSRNDPPRIDDRERAAGPGGRSVYAVAG